jgi:hypothetical protein
MARSILMRDLIAPLAMSMATTSSTSDTHSGPPWLRMPLGELRPVTQFAASEPACPTRLQVRLDSVTTVTSGCALQRAHHRAA